MSIVSFLSGTKEGELMPRKPPPRDVGSERQVAEAIEELMKLHGWTYEQLAQKMTDAGAAIWPSSIQKTIKSGRRITVDELIGYARAFETTPESMLQYGGKREPRTQESWRDLIAAEDLQIILRTTQTLYNDKIRGVQTEAARNAELRREIEARRDRHRKSAEREAKEEAKRDGADVSTPQALAQYIEDGKFYRRPALVACEDALKRQHRTRTRAGGGR
jgi:transcriptional regulator with XRE-family HTH domain